MTCSATDSSRPRSSLPAGLSSGGMRLFDFLEERRDVERLVEVERQQLETQNLLPNLLFGCDPQVGILRHERVQDRIEHVLAQVAVGLFAAAHHLGVEPDVVVDLLPLVERRVEPVAEHQRHQRQRQHLDQVNQPRMTAFWSRRRGWSRDVALVRAHRRRSSYLPSPSFTRSKL